MKCKYCHAEIENDSVFCPNCGKELPQGKRCVKCGEILDEDSEFCPKCGTRQSHGVQDVHKPVKPRSKSKKGSTSFLANPWFIVLMIALLGILSYLLFFNSGHKAKNDGSKEDSDTELMAPADSDSITTTNASMEQLKEDSLMKVAKLKADSLAFLKDSLKNHKDNKNTEAKEKPKTTVTPSRHQESVSARTVSNKSSVQTGTKNLGYGTYKGTLVSGKPHGVNGRLIYKTPHQIDSRDPKGRVAEPGDYVIGEFYEGHLVQGIWYDANNQVKGSILIGR